MTTGVYPPPRITGAPEGRYGERLLAAWLTTGRPADLNEHLAWYGPAPLGRPGGHEHPMMDAVAHAGLTGRGGAGFPTATKLRAVARAKRPGRILVANGMESEPAASKDKALLRLAPHLVLDGIALAAEAIGADEAHLCVAPSRSGLDQRLRGLISERRRAGLDPIEVQVHTPPHHYVSSESSALVNWLGGGEAKPTTTPPRTAERGVAGRPTLVDNVETLAHLALIARYGPGWFRSRGTSESPGTTLVTLAGAVADPGVYEAEFGWSLRDVLGLARPAANARAVLVGGYFGTWLPLQHIADLAFSGRGLAAAGANPGAGVLAVLPAQACGLAETARVLAYLAGQSARQCGPCRSGLPATADDFAQLAFGHCDRDGWERLERHIRQLPGRGACKHPDGGARLAASALRAFAPDVRRHLESGPCPAALHTPPLLPIPAAAIQDGAWR
ncbi:NADH-ubiquinone oxidoreductase-F iron-sulfur binding region domain-containing protein [Actinospica robiniae]|uniref:NADH-ubiquinone oxidoreductase-F iron-sulfur binding region domain-containing protein n=1 Tax=Actinospica robiniae TaxID=304901 RepID=UPI0003FA44F9|nr:NADH-ubiquinone oxidoreductase-F iron-sulfur binding region domain-containing protein [Actinospica robiniae]